MGYYDSIYIYTYSNYIHTYSNHICTFQLLTYSSHIYTYSNYMHTYLNHIYTYYNYIHTYSNYIYTHIFSVSHWYVKKTPIYSWDDSGVWSVRGLWVKVVCCDSRQQLNLLGTSWCTDGSSLEGGGVWRRGPINLHHRASHSYLLFLHFNLCPTSSFVPLLNHRWVSHVTQQIDNKSLTLRRTSLCSTIIFCFFKFPSLQRLITIEWISMRWWRQRRETVPFRSVP